MLLGLAITASLALAAFLFWFSRLALVGAAYKAKALASAIFVCGRSLDPERAPEVSADDYWAMRLFPARVEPDRVTVSVFGLGRRTAVHRPGLGAALTMNGLAEVRVPPPAAPSPDGLRLEEHPRLSAVAAEAFVEGGRRARRTRAVLVWKDGRLLAERYAPGILPTTPLPGWSMTKSVFSALVGVAVRRGLLALDRRDLFLEWSGDARKEISLEDLLRMRSGLKFTEVYSDPFSDVVKMLYARDDTSGYALGRTCAARPGEIWHYASGTSNLVSRLLREVLGDEEYWAFPRRALFDPLGMSRAVLEPDAAGTFVASSYLFATAREWLRFGVLFARGGEELLPPGWVAFCASPTAGSDGRYGAHWWLKLPDGLGGAGPAAADLPADTMHALGHEGQCLTVIPSEKLVVLRLGLSIKLDGWDHASFMYDVRRSLS